jgi:predicted Zn finger-like uncharacterized protein
VLIRCEKCSTLYELDDKLLPPQGAPVQCSKCQFVFKAYPAPPPHASAPERAANDAPEDLRVRPEMDAAEPLRSRRDEVVREGGALANQFDEGPPVLPGSTPRPSPVGERPYGSDPTGMRGGLAAPRDGEGDEPKFTADGRPIRKVPFPVAEPQHAGPRTPPVRAPAPKARTGGKVPLKWVIAAIVIVLLLIAAVVAWRAAGPDRTRDARPGQSRALPQGGTPETPPRK